jgi:YD repeat-containing protein
MRTPTVCLLIWLTGTVAASAQSTNIERDPHGRVSSVTSTTERGTERTDYTYTPTGRQETTTFEPAQRGYNPLGRGGYHPLGR